MDMAQNVLIALKMSGIAGQDKLAGIFDYLNETYGDGSPWHIRLVRTRAELTPELMDAALRGGTDGVILSIPQADDAAARLARITTPAVVMDLRLPPRKNLVFIRNSPEAIGRAAADHLVSMGICRSYAFVHTPVSMEWSSDRARSFSEALRDRGLWCEAFGADGKGSSDELERFLRKLPKPAGVFTANDDRGLEVLEAAARLHLRVPKDLAVLGINNDTLICEHCHPKLSSIEPDYAREGYLAAQALDRMMSRTGGRQTQAEDATLFVGVRQLVRRASTADVSHAGKLVQKTLVYIERNALRGIGVEDVVGHLGCSRRLADLRFRELQGTSILAAIIDRRLDAVKRRLMETGDPISAISSDCGFSNANYLKNLFRKRTGLTMRAWRDQMRTRSPVVHSPIVLRETSRKPRAAKAARTSG
jgi:LacI family transcriptional regulator